ncbi:hypothetical protein [Sphingomonas sp. Leaf28]|uniref:hypothetical protein n=1 Tax=Sphingomonas sp. Leaf28 TaxID=1735695 RepID=UPI0006F9AFFB|nr:hypothetical protein [Sphingomonas sp. Leaf28]KQN09074.1 hypothetical protein ASE79_14575 [Sphingomonas sp. Leaf28]
MNPLDNIILELERIVGEDANIQVFLPVQTGWLDYGLPAEQGPYPCLRIDGLTSLDDKLNRYYLNLKLWGMDMGIGFIEQIEQLRAALATSDKFHCMGYIHQPEPARNCSVFAMTFIP